MGMNRASARVQTNTVSFCEHVTSVALVQTGPGRFHLHPSAACLWRGNNQTVHPNKRQVLRAAVRAVQLPSQRRRGPCPPALHITASWDPLLFSGLERNCRFTRMAWFSVSTQAAVRMGRIPRSRSDAAT